MSVGMLVLVAVGLAITIAMALAIGYALRVWAVGPEAARRDLVWNVLIAVVVLVVSVGLFAVLPYQRFVTVFLLVIWLALLTSIGTWVRDRSRAGAVLLELGRTPGAKALLVAIACAAIALSIALFLWTQSTGEERARQLPPIALDLGLLIQVSFAYWFSSKQAVCDRGVFAARLLVWDQIEGYEWGHAAAGLTVRLRRRRGGLWRRYITVSVPYGHRAEVERVLAQHLSESRASASS